MNVQPDSSASLSSSSGARKRKSDEEERGVAGRFRRSARLLRHADFQRVYKQGRRHFGAHMTVFYLQREVLHRPCIAAMDQPRVGFTVPRALGGAVERNRIKRRLREAVRGNLAALNAPVDVVINPKKSAQTVDFAALRSEIARAFAVIQGNETKSQRKP